jgi:rhamnose transport system permease protein
LPSALRRPPRPYLGRAGWNAGLAALIVVVGVWATAAAPGFLDIDQLLGSGQSYAVSGLLALGLSLVVLVGEIDISLTSNLAFTTVVVGLLGQSGHGAALLIAVGLATGTALGALNGLMVAAFGMPSLAVTLGTMGAYQGAAYLVGGNKAYVKFPDAVTALGNNFVGRVPISLIIFAAFAVALGLLLGYTTLGRAVYATGRAPEVVRRSGMSVARTKVAVFTIGGFSAGLAALVFVGYYGSGGGSSASGTILSVVTAVALGGLNIYGGSGRISGVVLALVLLTLLQDGMGLVHVSTTAQTIVIGSLLVLSLAVSQLTLSIRQRRYRVDNG